MCITVVPSDPSTETRDPWPKCCSEHKDLAVSSTTYNQGLKQGEEAMMGVKELFRATTWVLDLFLPRLQGEEG